MREMAERKGGNVTYARYVAAGAPGTHTDAIDAQNSDDVPTASVDTIRALYQRLYRPENVMVVMVGDVDPAGVLPIIAQWFGDWRAGGPAPAQVFPPALRPERVAPVSVAAEPGGR